MIPVPQDGGDGDEDTDPLAGLKTDIAAAKGNALLVETTSGGWQEGKVAAPTSDWKQCSGLVRRQPPRWWRSPMSSFARVPRRDRLHRLAYSSIADGTSPSARRLRRWHLSAPSCPLARLVES